MMRRIRRIHLIGIGGVGMGGIAEVLINLGYVVSGSDLNKNQFIERLVNLGAKINIGHHAQHIQGCDVVVISSAIHKDNSEVLAARAQLIPIVPRAQMLAELMRFRYGIAVAGTHGKTTTTSLIASIFGEAKLDPTFIIGGKVNSIGANSRLGNGEYLIAEADESDSSFLHLQPLLAVVTNIDADHMDTYKGDFDVLKKAFLAFLHRLPFYGLAVLCIDDPTLRSLLPDIERPILTYGISEDADYRLHTLQQKQGCIKFLIDKPGQNHWLELSLNLPGIHNGLNALAAAIVAYESGIKETIIQNGLKVFSGIERRSQSYGEINTLVGSILLIDDYGHHPREIAATIEAIRFGWPNRRLVVIFQPHRYTRTRDLFQEFIHILSRIDLLILLEIYSAGETPILGIDSLILQEELKRYSKIKPLFIEKNNLTTEFLINVLQQGDILLTLGAGDIATLAKQLATSLRREIN
ncbi:UDP-N-acetylmuramate--L-alanine ligase [Candidatus Nitrosacidococcus sp. I8]|nr:UDP-N-acetylmuramate--L-alanine ligase [Candidatus Nitrosacidococcus sp. I8]